MFHKHLFKYNEDKTSIWCECGEVREFNKNHECKMKEFFENNIEITNLTTREVSKQQVKYFACECGKTKAINITTGEVIHDDFKV